MAAPILFAALLLCPAAALAADAVLRGAVSDPTHAPVPNAKLRIRPLAGGTQRTAESGPDGAYQIGALLPGSYRVTATQAGFAEFQQDVTLASGVATVLPITLELAGRQETVIVEDSAPLVVNTPVSAQSVDARALADLPPTSPGSGLNDAILLSAPAVAADSNGFFHPLGDHSQVSYVIDGQPIGDQRNKIFSTAIPLNAVQSMDLISGSPAAEFGDKTSLVVEAQTRSGLGAAPHGSLRANYGSFGTLGEELTFGAGTTHWGNFGAFNAERSGRFLDTPEYRPIHAIGNSGTFFDRADYQPSARDVFHLTFLAARNWTQIPNTYDQPRQDQRQKVLSFNVAPGYQRIVGARGLFTASAFVRQDRVHYYPSRNAFDDHPATLEQHRTLLNYGTRLVLSLAEGRHAFKLGGQFQRTHLDERFTLAITDPNYNAPGSPDYLPGLATYDLTRGGAPFHYAGAATIGQAAFHAQDNITLGPFLVSAGLRLDRYRGLTRGSGTQPRAGISYRLAATGTVIRIGYSRTMETPVNENLVVSSSTGAGGLAGALYGGAAEQRAIPLGRRNQFDAGIQQPLGPFAALTVDYFRKYTRNAYDFDVLFSTPLTFPIGWAKSKLDGISARIATTNIRGLRAYLTMGHANARFFGPEVGGIVFNSNLAVGAYRQDHDQVYQQTAHLAYAAPRDRWTANFTWRYDSGLVVGAVNNIDDALQLTAAQQSAIGLYCGDQRATLSRALTTCTASNYGADRIHILAPGAADPDRNPPRAKSRHILDATWGTDRLYRTDRYRATLRLSVLNLTGQAALYNFLSPFSGTHWLPPRTFRAEIGFAW